MTDYTQTYSYTKVDNQDIIEAQDFEDLETEYALIETAIATKADSSGADISCGQLDWDSSVWTRIASADSPYSASGGERIFCTCDGAIEIDLPAPPAPNETIWIRTNAGADTNNVTLDPAAGDSIAGQAADVTLVIDLAHVSLELVADASDNWEI
jgi:hypothetical protein